MKYKRFDPSCSPNLVFNHVKIQLSIDIHKITLFELHKVICD